MHSPTSLPCRSAAARRTAVAWMDDPFGARAIGVDPRLWGASSDLADRLTADHVMHAFEQLSDASRAYLRHRPVFFHGEGKPLVLGPDHTPLSKRQDRPADFFDRQRRQPVESWHPCRRVSSRAAEAARWPPKA